MNKEERNYHWSRITLLGKILYYVGAVRFFKDGDGMNSLWRWYHPGTWLLFVICMFIFPFTKEKITDCFPVRLSSYWKERKEEIEWI